MGRASSGLQQALLFLEIIKRIPRHRWITSKELLNSLHDAGFRIEELTLQRYLKQLYEDSGLPIERNELGKPFGYRMSVDDSLFDFIKFTPQESLLMRLMEENLKYQIPARIAKSMEPIFEVAKNSLLKSSALKRKEYQWLNKVAVISDTLPRIPPSVKPRIFDTVSNALFENKKIYVKYQNIHGKISTKSLNPLGLVQQDHRLYLVSKFEGYENIRHIALNRIIEAKQLNECSVTPNGFNLKRYLQERPFNYSSDASRQIHLSIRFTSSIFAHHLNEVKLAKNQILKKLNDNGYQLDVQIADTRLLDQWINNWRTDANITFIHKRPLETLEEFKDNLAQKSI